MDADILLKLAISEPNFHSRPPLRVVDSALANLPQDVKLRLGDLAIAPARIIAAAGLQLFILGWNGVYESILEQLYFALDDEAGEAEKLSSWILAKAIGDSLGIPAKQVAECSPIDKIAILNRFRTSTIPNAKPVYWHVDYESWRKINEPYFKFPRLNVSQWHLTPPNTSDQNQNEI